MVHKFVIGLLACCVAASVFAQDVVQYRTTDRVDPRDVARILGGEAPAPMKWRSVRLTDQAASDPAPALAEVATRKAAPGALALPVQFAFGSASLLSEARPQLDALAEGIRLIPAGQKVVIEGHTDAIGSDVYNLQLSNRRALAVKEYLVGVHGIDADRLATQGFGEYRLINERDPNAPENRRVQFRGG